jgi:hypothetical protein
MTTSTSRSPFIRRSLTIAGSALGAGALVIALAALGGTPANSADSIAAPSPSSTVTQQPQLGIYDKGTFSVQLAVYNNTTQTMIYDADPSISTVGGGHWATRPVTLAPGASMITTAYSDQPDGFSWQVVWQQDNGDYSTVNLDSAELTNENPHNISVITGTGWQSDGVKTPDLAYTADVSNSGGAHSWVTVSFKPAVS